MQIARVKIENFRAHTSTEIPLTQLGSLIGENNAGKSSVLHAIQFALEDRRVEHADFQDEGKPVVVSIQLTDITEHDLQRVGQSHRDRVAGMIRDGKLTIVRSQSLGEKAEAKYLKLMPSDPKWSIDSLNAGTNRKSGAALRVAAVDLRPALDELLAEKPKKDDVLSAWTELNDKLPLEELEEKTDIFPTGLATPIKPLFPSVIYVESVKDASIETKTTGTSAFAKLLGMLFDEVQGHFADIEKQFNTVHRKLSRHFDDSGDPKDTRLPAVARIESVIEQYVTASFPGVKVQMDIPAPTLNMLLSSADLFIDDGHIGKVSSKGDGLKRSILFALLRAYVDIRDHGLTEPGDENGDETVEVSAGAETTTPSKGPKRSYLLLFEEPELYLHPRAQRQLMAALEGFAKDHQVLVTTHSPGFFQPGTKGFTRLYKTPTGVSSKPVDLTLSLRDAYQVVRHENNEAAFFAQAVVLVEGDSDTFVYPHLARLFSKKWDDVERNVMFVKIEGKGNITRYRDFFNHFDVPIRVITDLDALSKGFNHLTSTATIKEDHGKLISAVRTHIAQPNSPNGDKVREIVRSRTPRELWGSAQVNLATWQRDKTDAAAEAIADDLSQLFDAGNGDAVLAHLINPPTEEIAAMIDDVISALALEGVHVLRRGDLEHYCRTTSRSDKVSTAMKFCAETTTLDQFKAVHETDGDAVAKELEGIFASVFRTEPPRV